MYVRRYARHPLATSKTAGTRWLAGMSGVSSQPSGRRVSLRALSGVSSQPSGPRVLLPVATLGSLGDTSTPTVVDPATRDYQRRSLELQEKLLDAQRTWADGDRMQKWIQIAATLSIPVAAAIWRAIGVGRRRQPT